MNKTIKRNVLLTAALTIMLCVSLIAGATFALFTSESKVNIAVTSGKVDVVATVDESSVWTKDLNDADYIEGEGNMYEATVNFGNDGLTITEMVPGDAIKFNIAVENRSDVTIKYRTIIACESDDGFFAGLKVTINGEEYIGETKVSNYEELNVGSEPIKVPVSIELTKDATNDCQGKTLKVSYKVEAIQGNAVVDEDTSDVFYIYNAADVMALSENGNNGKSIIEFLNDIDMFGKDFVTLETNVNGFTVLTEVRGNGHKITNLCAPLFDLYAREVTIKDLTIKDSNMTKNTAYRGDYGFGAFITDAGICEIEFDNCHVINCNIDGENSKAAAFVGYATRIISFNNCSVQGGSIKANGSVGGFVGHTTDYYDNQGIKHGGQTITNCSVSGVTITAVDEDWRIGTFIGTTQGTTNIINCTSQGNTLVMNDSENEGQTIANPNHELFGRIVNEGVTGHDDATLVINGVTYTAGA